MPQIFGCKLLESNSSDVLKIVLTTHESNKIEKDEDDHAKSERAIAYNESDFEILDNEKDEKDDSDQDQIVDFSDVFQTTYKRESEHR
jgi:hypothetical protein